MVNNIASRIELYSRESKPYGKSWEEWVAIWWKWSLESELQHFYPVVDKTGEFCDKNQFNPNVWFLAGTAGGAAVRTCTMPSKKSIFFPLVNDMISFAEYKHLKTVEDLSAYAKADLDETKLLEAVVDGFKLENLRDYRVRSKEFKITLPPRITEGAPILTDAVSDGYWVFLKPLSIGDHSIYFKGKKLAYDDKYNRPDQKNEPVFEVEVSYGLEVV